MQPFRCNASRDRQEAMWRVKVLVAGNAVAPARWRRVCEVERCWCRRRAGWCAARRAPSYTSQRQSTHSAHSRRQSSRLTRGMNSCPTETALCAGSAGHVVAVSSPPAVHHSNHTTYASIDTIISYSTPPPVTALQQLPAAASRRDVTSWRQPRRHAQLQRPILRHKSAVRRWHVHARETWRTCQVWGSNDVLYSMMNCSSWWCGGWTLSLPACCHSSWTTRALHDTIRTSTGALGTTTHTTQPHVHTHTLSL